MQIDTIDFLFQLAVILFSAKMLGILMRKIGLPQVLGYILAGLIIGPAIWGLFFEIPDNWIFPLRENNMLKAFAEVGVIFVMFTAGLETDLNDLKNTGLVSFLIALGGVLLPLGMGFGIAVLFLGTENLLGCLFIGVIMTATSVGITVETLRELGKLKSKVGTIVLSAAIIDDVLGLIVLTIALSLNGTSADSSPLLSLINPNGLPIISILWMFVFFVVAIGLGILLIKVFKYLEKRHPHTRRIPILSLVVCFLYAFMAEKGFGVADITGAYLLGLFLSQNQIKTEVFRKINVPSYMFFSPIFFASVGLKVDLEGITGNIIWFSVLLLIIAILTKIIGCGLGARTCGFNGREALQVGVGMVSRGEVALIVAQKGYEMGLLDIVIMPAVIIVVIATTIITPIVLKKIM